MDANVPSETLQHQSKLMETISKLFNNNQLSDINLMVNCKLALKAHRFVLAVHSDVFKSMLDSERWPDSVDHVVHLTEDEDCLAHFEEFVSYLYSGTITLDTENVLPLHVLSEKYNVQELRESTQSFMLVNVTSPSTYNHAITWHKYANLIGLRQLEEECLKFITWNTNTVIKSPDWTLLEPYQLSALLQRSDMVVEDEVVLFQALVSWLSLHPNYAEEMLAHIRYPMMPPEKLFDLLSPGSLPDSIASYLCRESLLVYQAHVLSMETISQRNNMAANPFTMRIYTSERFSQVWDISGYKTMNKIALSKCLSTRHFQLKTEWNVNYSPKGHQILNYTHHIYLPEVVQDDDFSTLTVRLGSCEPADMKHTHKICILLYQCINSQWFVGDVQTLEVPHTGEAKINDLIPLSKRDRYISNGTMKVHLITQTNWENEEEI